MHLESVRVRSRRVLLITGAVVLTSTLVAAWPWRWPEFARILGNNAIVGICVGGLYWLTEPLLIGRTRRLSPKWQWGLRILVWTAVWILGILCGLAILAARGVFPWSQYAAIFWDAFLPGTLINAICATAFTIHQGVRYQMQYEVTQARLQSLEARLRPHFLFNALNSIVALIPEDPVSAERVTLKLADLLRYSLDSGNRSTVPLEQELKVTTDYLEIEKTRFGARLRYSVDVPPELQDTSVPPFCLQTLVENSVKYGGGEIRIQARDGAGRLVLTVWDSGEGFDGKQNEIVGHGLHDLRNRLAVLWGGEAALEYPRDTGGTAVEVSIPRKAAAA